MKVSYRECTHPQDPTVISRLDYSGVNANNVVHFKFSFLEIYFILFYVMTKVLFIFVFIKIYSFRYFSHFLGFRELYIGAYPNSTAGMLHFTAGMLHFTAGMLHSTSGMLHN